jgi:hypothetical protein
MMITKRLRHLTRRPRLGLFIAVLVALVVMGRRSLAQGPNPTSIENGLGGTPASLWDISGAGDPSIQGFASDSSVNTGGTIAFKINTPSSNYHIDVYRLGYYGGAGARLVAGNVPKSAVLPQSQPACLNNSTTGLYDCGNWAVSASWTATNAVSGIYVAKLIRDDLIGPASHIVFVVRDDARQADVVVQTSDTTWQAYNRYGIADATATAGSLYCGGPISNAGSAYANACSNRSAKVSYNRPIDTREHSPQSFLFNAEYPMVRWLEANGYNVKYLSGVDTERRAGDLVGSTKPKVFLSSGHDEYWSAGQRASVEAARAAGVNLAFFSGNEMYWKTRFEASIDGSGTTYRTLVAYKDTLAGVKLDPTPGVATGTWRDLRFGTAATPPLDGGRPENGVTGNFWTVNSGTPAPAAITVPAAMASMRFWRNTPVAALTTGTATLAPSSLGYEWDEDLDNGARPAGIIHLSSTTVNGVEKIIDFGGTTGIGTATHTLTLYRHSSGALVFGAGTVQWAWGLDANHDDHTQSTPAHVTDQAMKQATMNLLADMGAQPATVQSGLTASAGSSDTAAPTSTISAPAAGATVGSGLHVTISGTASDAVPGQVAAVEVSIDGGVSWHTATGRTAWSYDWIPGPLGPATIKSRAIDDSGNIGTAGSGTVVTVSAGSNTNLGLWPSSPTPAIPDAGDGNAVELGVKFRSDTNSLISGVRFFKSASNAGTHVGNLWTIAGTLLASATFVNESPSGWQTATFATPVTLAAGTTYVVSYHTNVGHYSVDSAYFGSVGVDSAPFHAPDSVSVGGNGVYAYGPTGFPTSTFNGNNYWVDVLVDRTAPTIADVHTVIGDVHGGTPPTASAVITWNTTEESNSRVDYSTVSTFPSGQTVTVSDPAFVISHSLTLTGLQLSTQYYFRLSSADRAGNIGTCTNDTCPAPGTGGSAGGGPGPLGFTMPGPTMHDTTTADFSAGTSTGVYVSETADGEVILSPSLGTEFSGSTLPTGWATSVWSAGGSAVVSGGRLVASGVRVATCVPAGGACPDGAGSYNVSPGRSVEFVATFTGDPYQHAGLGQTLAVGGEPFAMFSTVDASGQNPDGSLFVRTANGAGTDLANSLGTGFFGAPHRFRIDWNGSSVAYSIDGSPAFMFDPVVNDFVPAVHALAVAGPMRTIAASEFNGLSGKVVVDWNRMTPYVASGTFTSRVFDAGVKTTWQSLQLVAKPSASSVAITVRTSNDGSTWTGFGAFAAGVQSRYIQYQATLATTDVNQTPELDDITITGTAPPPVTQVTPTIAWATPADIAYGTPLGATQLNAAATVAGSPVAGTFAYTPAAGTVLSVGAGQTLSATFTPSDTAQYASTGASVQITVNKATPTVTFTGAPPTAAFGSSFSVTSSTNASTAAVITASGPCSIVGNLVTMTSGTGTCLMTANWAADANYTTASATQSTIAAKIAPTVTFTGAPATAAFGSSFNVASTTNASTPAVIAASGGCSNAGNSVTMTSGTLTCLLTATWATDTKYLGATATQSTTASKINPMTTAVVSSASATNYGQLVTLTGTITSDKGAPTGTVTYKDVLTYNGVTLPQAVIGTASVSGLNALYSTFALGAGSHSITVVYGGDSNFNGSTSTLIIVTVTPVGIAGFDPTSVSFPSQPVGVGSMAMPVTLTNIGDANLTINSIQMGGDNSGDFAISSNTCTSSLAAGASCVVNVKFKPMATGTRTASLIFTDNDNGISLSKQPISLAGSSLSTSKANFTNKAIPAGKSIWFASELTVARGPRDGNNVFKDMSNHPVRIFVTNGMISFTANGTNYSVPVPDALITFSPSVTQATTTFDTVNNRWVTTLPTVHPITRLRQFEIQIGRIFASGVTMPVPAGGLPGGIKNVTWSAAYTTDTPGMQLEWRWGAAVYSTFSTNYNALQVKPADPVRASWALYTNNDQAGTPEAFKQYFNPSGGGTADDADDFTGDQTASVGVVPDVQQANIAPIPVVFPGTQSAGTTAGPIIATITNNHQTLPLIVSSLGISGIDFTMVSAGSSPCSLTSPTTLAGGTSCTVGVTFSPKDMGTRTGTLNIGFSTPAGIAADEAPAPFKLDLVGIGK